jgi:pseudouridine 5'-phosphatase
LTRPSRPIRAVAFDMDGLIFDTESLFFRVATEMMAQRGKVFTPVIMAAMIGRQAPAAGLAFKTLGELDESPEELIAEAKRHFDARMDAEVRTNQGVIELIERLEAINMPRCVATSSRLEYASRLLGRHALTSRFSFVLTAENVTRSKPDPEIYLKAAKRFGIEPSEMLVLEDSPAGLASASAAGAFAVGVPHEHSPADSLGAARVLVERLDAQELIDLIRGHDYSSSSPVHSSSGPSEASSSLVETFGM